MPQLVVFLDDGGVMNDNQARGLQWQHLVGEYFPPILGGEPVAWAEANRVVIERISQPDNWQARLQACSDYQEWDDAYQLDWLNWMCQLVGVPAPAPQDAIELARRGSAHIIAQVRSAYAGAVDAITALHASAVTLHTASGESSRELDAYLRAMAVRHCFGRLYGPDLINLHKTGPAYYTRLLADCGVAPAEALIVDDNPTVIGWIRQAGARPLQVDPGAPLIPASIPALAQLPGWLERYR